MKTQLNSTRRNEFLLVFFALSLLNNLPVFSQKTSKVTYEIKQYGERFEGDLYYKNDFSIFYYKRNPEKNFKINEGSNKMRIFRKNNTVYYYSIVNRKFLVQDFILNKKLYIKDSITKNTNTDRCKTTDWKITNVRKKILGFDCNQAIRFFRGRKYTAYYTDKIPSPFGPWKLNGLPGLILDFSNDKISMRAVNISLNSNEYSDIKVDDILEEFDKKKIISQSEFHRLRIKKLKQKAKAMQSSLPSNVDVSTNINTDNILEKFCD